MPRQAWIAVAQTKRIHLTQSLFMIFLTHNLLLSACCSWRDMIAIRAKHMKARSILTDFSSHTEPPVRFYTNVDVVLKGYFYSFFCVPTLARGLNKRCSTYCTFLHFIQKYFFNSKNANDNLIYCLPIFTSVLITKELILKILFLVWYTLL